MDMGTIGNLVMHSMLLSSSTPSNEPLTTSDNYDDDDDGGEQPMWKSFLEDLFPSFKSTEKKRKMYEQSLDPEYFHPSYGMHLPEPKFYDDFNHLTNFMKDPQPQSQPPPPSFHNVLPTPPTTPDKVPMSYGSFTHHPAAPQPQHFMQPHQTQRNQFSPTGDMQVVPDYYTEEDENLQQEAHPYQNQIEDAYTNNSYMQLPLHTSHEIPNIGAKRLYPGMNQPSHNPAMEYYMNNMTNENYMRHFGPYESMFYAKRPRFDSSDSLEPELSRAQHNVLERQRRNDLKLRFNILRDNIPELASNEKAPKIQILKKGLEYLTILKSEEQMLLADKELEKQKKIILIERLKLLREGQLN